MKNQSDDPIKQPYKAPDGYFDHFEDRLRARLPKQEILVVTHRKQGVPLKYWLSAAAVLLLAGFEWLMYRPSQSVNTPAVVKQSASNKRIADSVVLKALAENHVKNEEQLMEHIAEEIQQKAPEIPVVENSSEKQIANELEEEGIIVAEINDNLLDEIEIWP